MKSGARGAWVATALLMVALSGCGEGPRVMGNGHLVQEEREVPEFETLTVSSDIAVKVVMDPSQPRKVRLVGDANLLALMRTEILGPGWLSVSFRPAEVESWESSNDLRVEVTVPTLRSLSTWGDGSVDVSGSVVVPGGFSLETSGGGSVRAQGLDLSSFYLNMRGGGQATLQGRVDKMTSRLSGWSNLWGRQLSVQSAELTSSDGAYTEMRVSESLRVTASDGAKVLIIGQPTVLEQTLSGGATLEFE
jgi:hypothetical protein